MFHRISCMYVGKDQARAKDGLIENLSKKKNMKEKKLGTPRPKIGGGQTTMTILHIRFLRQIRPNDSMQRDCRPMGAQSDRL